MIVELWFSVHVEPSMGHARTYKRVVDYPSVPRVGDRVEFTDGGWSEVVRDVWWTFDGKVLIEFRQHVTDSAGDKMLAFASGPNATMAYVSEEDLSALEPAGWESS